MKYFLIALVTIFVTGFSQVSLFGIYAADDFDLQSPEKNILHAPNATQEKVKSSQDEKNVISDADDRDEDSFVKSSEDSLDDDNFAIHPDPDDRDL